jgi:hypothetical protein
MNLLMNFLTILAWVGAVGGALLLALRIYGAVTYTDLDRAWTPTRASTASSRSPSRSGSC